MRDQNFLTVAACLLAVTGFCIYQVNPKVGRHSKIKCESHCEKEYKKYCLNGFERYYVVDKDIVSCNCTWLYGGNRIEKCNARHSLHSLVFVIRVNYSLLVIKHLSTLCNNLSTESILENCIQTVHVLIGEAKCDQFL